jgi:hypothetical protein
MSCREPARGSQAQSKTRPEDGKTMTYRMRPQKFWHMLSNNKQQTSYNIQQKVLLPVIPPRGTPPTREVRSVKRRAALWPIHSRYQADWDNLTTPHAVIKYRKDGKSYNTASGGGRNQQMIDDAAPDGVVAFPGGDGTAD